MGERKKITLVAYPVPLLEREVLELLLELPNLLLGDAIAAQALDIFGKIQEVAPAKFQKWDLINLPKLHRTRTTAGPL